MEGFEIILDGAKVNASVKRGVIVLLIEPHSGLSINGSDYSLGVKFFKNDMKIKYGSFLKITPCNSDLERDRNLMIKMEKDELLKEYKRLENLLKDLGQKV